MLTLGRGLNETWDVTLAAGEGRAGTRLLAQAQSAGLEVWRHGGSRPFDRLEGWLRNSEVDVFHIHAGIAWEGHEAVLAGRRAGISAVVRTEHLPDVVTAEAQRAAYRALLPQLDRVVCVSTEAATTFRAAGVPEERLRVVRNGIEPLAEHAQRLGLPDDARLVLAVGRLTEQKGFDVLVEAAVELEETYVYLVGDGPLEEELQAAIDARGLRERARLLGRRDDVGALLAGANVLAMPSWFEGLPIVALEAMSLGVPVVGTRVCGLTEVVVDGKTGRLVTSGDAAELARALEEVLSSPKLAALWGEAGQRRQRECFGAKRMVAETAAVYDEVLSEMPARARRRAYAAAPRTRVGFVGAGGIAGRHLANLLDFADVELVGVADPVAERAAGMAARCGATAYPDHAALLEHARPDALYICVPPGAHGPAELDAAAAGVPFFVEKPVAIELETAERIAASVASLVTAVGYHWRYLDIYERARALLKANPAQLALGYWLDATPPPGWWVRRDQSGGQTIEQTTHVLDLARTLVGEVATVYAASSRVKRDDYPESDIDEVSTATLRFATGAVGSVSSTCLLGWPHRIGLHTVSDGMMLELAEFELMVDVGEGRPVTPAEGDPFVRADRDFVDAVQGKGNRIRTPYADALQTHRLACAVARSAAIGELIQLAEEASRV